MITRPNIFSFGTSELTQDAALCWLLKWGDLRNASVDAGMQSLGWSFINALFAASGVPPPDPCEVEVYQQVRGIDIVALVGGNHVIAIEDKVHCGDDSNKLKHYAEILSQEYPTRLAVCVHVNTGDVSSLAAKRRGGWTTFSRGDLLRLLGNAEHAHNDVHREFAQYLELMEASANEYQSVPPLQWREPAWRSFFQAVGSALDAGDWQYVNNPKGGFMGFWWGWQDIQGGKVYLQLEQNKLVMKTEPDKEQPRLPLRNRLIAQVKNGKFGPSFKQPKRLGQGAAMTFAEYDSDYRKVSPNGLLDLNATVALLSEMQGAISLVS